MQISSQRQQQPLPTGSLRGAQPVAQRPATSPADAKPQSISTANPKVDGTGAPDVASNVARLDGLTNALMERFANAAENAPESERPAFREAFAALESGLSRLRAGLSDGSLQPGDVQRGVSNIFQGVRGVLDAARAEPTSDAKAADSTVGATVSDAAKAPAALDAAKAPVALDAAKATDGGKDAVPAKPMDADATDTAPAMSEIVRNRFEGFADSVLARLANAEMPDDQRSAMMSGITEAFASATARLDAALFNPQSGESIDRGTYQELFSASLGALQDQLARLFGGDEPTKNGVVYGADRSKEGLAQTGSTLDLAG
jgi:hypothetical protein